MEAQSTEIIEYAKGKRSWIDWFVGCVRAAHGNALLQIMLYVIGHMSGLWAINTILTYFHVGAVAMSLMAFRSPAWGLNALKPAALVMFLVIRRAVGSSLGALDGVRDALLIWGVWMLPVLFGNEAFGAAIFGLAGAYALMSGIRILWYKRDGIDPGENALSVAYGSVYIAAITSLVVTVLIAQGKMPLAKTNEGYGSSPILSRVEHEYSNVYQLVTPAHMDKNTPAEACAVLQRIVHAECERLGIEENEPVVHIAVMDIEQGGFYDPKSNIVCINANSLWWNDVTAVDAVEAAIHEVGHAFQHVVADGVVPETDEATLLKEAQELAQSGEEYLYPTETTFQDYVMQPAETSVRTYANRRTRELLGEWMSSEEIDRLCSVYEADGASGRV